MAIDKNLLTGSTTMLILKLLEGQDMYGYQMIGELARRSDNTFELKAGTLYPLLHSLEEKGLISSYEKDEDTQRPRRYYKINRKGRKLLAKKHAEWTTYASAVKRFMEGGVSYANA